MTEKIFVVWHDNGVPGQRGYSEYTESELVEKYGTVSFLITCYDRAGIQVYTVE